MTLSPAGPRPARRRRRYADVPPVILVAPNVSEQMGGEAIKALHIALELGSGASASARSRTSGCGRS